MSLIPVVPKFIILEHVFIDVSCGDLQRCYEDTESLCSSIDEKIQMRFSERTNSYPIAYAKIIYSMCIVQVAAKQRS